MSEVKHTPGPWTSYSCNLERYSQVITAKGAMVRVAYTGLNHHDQVAMTKEVYGGRMTYGPGEETAANARLITAAPDLLAALQKFIDYEKAMDSRDDVSGMLIYAEFSSMARAALIKAGAQP